MVEVGLGCPEDHEDGRHLGGFSRIPPQSRDIAEALNGPTQFGTPAMQMGGGASRLQYRKTSNLCVGEIDK